MRAVIYARYSSDLQRATSIADQVRDCHIYASRQGSSVIGSYEDHAISGASTLTRSALTTLMQDAKSGLFDVVIVESLDRLSRNLADTAKLHDMLKFYGVEVQTISSGPVSTMQIGFMGTMSQIFLDELGKKTKRGQRGRVEAGCLMAIIWLQGKSAESVKSMQSKPLSYAVSLPNTLKGIPHVLLLGN